ncbi:MAG TPA: EVE domain-containing protein [Candidatus Paceibacterota bacterium]|nr:EVE domain-containing protein [Candidatus Paceibacterota bacterium]
MNYWLIKSEGDCYSIDDFKRDKRTAWEGIRNYQARNFMIRDMKVGDLLLFYHSIVEPGVYGLAKVVSKAHPDVSQFNKKDEHFEPKATKIKPLWYCVDVAFVKKFKHPVLLEAIKKDPKLDGMMVRAKGSRLSVQPVSEKHFKHILEMAMG